MAIYVCDIYSHPFVKGIWNTSRLRILSTSGMAPRGVDLFAQPREWLRGGVFFCGLDFCNLDGIPLTEGAGLSSTYSSPLLNFSPALLRLGCCRVGEEIQPGSFLRQDCVSVLASFSFLSVAS